MNDIYSKVSLSYTLVREWEVRRNVRSGLAPYFISEKALTKAIWPEAVRGLTGMAGSGQSLMHLFGSLYSHSSFYYHFVVSSLYSSCLLMLSFVFFFLLFVLYLSLFFIAVCSHFVVSSLIVVRPLFVVVLWVPKIKLCAMKVYKRFV
jgi:hypothetical protein